MFAELRLLDMSKQTPCNNHPVKAVISLPFPPAAGAAAAGCWWHIWPIIGGSWEDDVSWKLVHTWWVSRRPGGFIVENCVRAKKKKKLISWSPSLHSFLLLSSMDLWYIKAYFLANQYCPLLSFITPLPERGLAGGCNIQFINHAVKKCHEGNCSFLTHFERRQILLVG